MSSSPQPPSLGIARGPLWWARDGSKGARGRRGEVPGEVRDELHCMKGEQYA